MQANVQRAAAPAPCHADARDSAKLPGIAPHAYQEYRYDAVGNLNLRTVRLVAWSTAAAIVFVFGGIWFGWNFPAMRFLGTVVLWPGGFLYQFLSGSQRGFGDAVGLTLALAFWVVAFVVMTTTSGALVRAIGQRRSRDLNT